MNTGGVELRRSRTTAGYGFNYRPEYGHRRLARRSKQYRSLAGYEKFTRLYAEFRSLASLARLRLVLSVT